ncbi:MAG: hypothetical protein LUF85_12160 [Bacteroides sp.]|nr:hypothetical protein [Bacteroides sp.]
MIQAKKTIPSTPMIQSTTTPQRHLILDALRGMALLGICLANYPEFSLYTFLDSSVTAAMPTAPVDTVVKYLQYIFIDGKFYTLFSILFGIGFSLMLTNAREKGINGLRIFYRRMAVLLLIGLIHLVFLWAGDILILYAFVGFFLPLFRKLSDKKTPPFRGSAAPAARRDRHYRHVYRLGSGCPRYLRHPLFPYTGRHQRRKFSCMAGATRQLYGCSPF